MTSPASQIQPIAWAWVRVAGDCRLPMVGFVGLYRDPAPADRNGEFVVQSVVSGNGRTVRQTRLGFSKLARARQHFRSMSAFFANDRRAMGMVGEPRFKLQEAA